MSDCPAPNLVTQLCTSDGQKRPDPTAGSDCALACAKMAIRFGTCNHVSPSIETIRKQAGLDKPDPPPDDFSTTATEYARAVNAFDDEAQAKGFVGLNAGVHERQDTSGLWDVVQEAKKWVTVLIDYGVVNDLEPKKSGDKNFRGSHAVGVFGFKPKAQSSNGRHKVKVFDPLADGRASNIPSGPQWWDWTTLEQAADHYAKEENDGLVTWITTPRADRVQEPPDPEPEPCEDQVAVLQDVLGETLGVIDGVLSELRAIRSTIEDALPDRSAARTTRVRSGVKPKGD